MKKFTVPMLGLLLSVSVFAQKLQRPKLVVGIVVDQMRWDYLYRFYDRFGNDGFKRLMREGMSCENAMVPYTPTYTAAGHSSIYTGSVPALNGIVGNNWYDEQQGITVYCTDDNTVTGVGSRSEAGKMSPRNLWSSTITDELRLATNFKSKVIAVALKDRGSILPGGHAANAAYWFDNATGSWISSTYYMKTLPDWVVKMNERRLPDTYLKQNWNTMYPLGTYTQSTADTNAYEGRFPGEDQSFPHITSGITNNKYESFRYMPAANTYTIEMAKAAIQGEHLGKGSATDFLAVSFSSTDYAGHAFGPNSIEEEDMYLQLDRDLGGFLKYLDASIGRGQYLLFLTADHAVAHNAEFLQDHQLPAGALGMTAVRKQLNDSLLKKFGVNNLVYQWINAQLFIDENLVAANKLSIREIKDFITAFLIKQPAVSAVVDLQNIEDTPIPQKLKMMLTNGYNQKLSGDLQLILKPQYFDTRQTGTTHGLWNPYDAHIPLLWYGWNIKHQQVNREVYMTDIAPTVAALLHIQMPNASIGNVITEVTGQPEKNASN